MRMSKILFVCSDSKESSMYWAIEKSKQTSTNSSRDTTKTPASSRETHILCCQSFTSTSSWLMLRVRGRLVSLGHWMSPSRQSKAACFYLARVYRSFRASAGFHTKSWHFSCRTLTSESHTWSCYSCWWNTWSLWFLLPRRLHRTLALVWNTCWSRLKPLCKKEKKK